MDSKCLRWPRCIQVDTGGIETLFNTHTHNKLEQVELVLYNYIAVVTE